MDASLRAKVAVAEEIALRANDPLRAAWQKLTATQSAWVNATGVRIKVCEGGNQSGKTWTGVIDFLLEALGLGPYEGLWRASAQQPTWKGWYATVTYELFSQQGWEHFKRLLLFTGETVHQVPTRRIVSIGWDKKHPERPMYLRLKRADGSFAEVWIKSYEQGVGTFQSAGVNRVHLDEECTAGIWQEVQLRGVTKSGRISVSATPVMGVAWLADLRRLAETSPADVCHARFDTRENPAADPAQIAAIVNLFKARPELIDLRLGGFPLAMEGLVYSDLTFTAEHVCDPFRVPDTWTRYRVIDPSWRNCACAWFAVAPKELEIVCYRDYIGHERTIKENCQHIVGLSTGERIQRTWIDRNYCQKHEESGGEKVIEIYRRNGVACVESVPIGIIPGIYDTHELLTQMVEILQGSGARGQGSVVATVRRPRFRVFRTCEVFLEERRRYKWPDAREKGNIGPQNPVDRDNHVMKCWVYFWAAKPRWIPPALVVAPSGSLGEVLQRDRMAGVGRGKRL